MRLLVATVDRWPETDGRYLAGLSGQVQSIRGVDAVNARYSSTGAGVLTNLDVRHGAVSGVNRVLPVSDGRYSLYMMESFRLESGVIVQVEYKTVPV